MLASLKKYVLLHTGLQLASFFFGHRGHRLLTNKPYRQQFVMQGPWNVRQANLIVYVI